MSGQLRAELLKIRSTRTTVGLLLGMVGLTLLFSLLTGLLSKAPDLVTAEDQRMLLSVGSLAGVFSALAGIMLVSSEYRYGTIRPTFLFTPRRARVLRAKVAAGVLAGLAFGIVPAWRALSTRLHEPLKEAGRGNTLGPGQHKLRDGLVIAEVSLALVLLVGAGLMLRSFYRVLHADAGFSSEGIVIANVALPQ